MFVLCREILNILCVSVAKYMQRIFDEKKNEKRFIKYSNFLIISAFGRVFLSWLIFKDYFLCTKIFKKP